MRNDLEFWRGEVAVQSYYDNLAQPYDGPGKKITVPAFGSAGNYCGLVQNIILPSSRLTHERTP